MGALLVVFAIQNTLITTITLLSWHLSAPSALIFIATLALGSIATLLSLLPSFMRDDRAMKKLAADNKTLADELSKYHITIPIAPPTADAGQLIMARAPREFAHLPR